MEQKQTEEALRESEARFRNAFDYAAIGMAIVGLDGENLNMILAIKEENSKFYEITI